MNYRALCPHCLLGLSICVSVKYLKESVSKRCYHPGAWLLVSQAHKGAAQNKRLHLTFAFSLPLYPSSCLSARAVLHANTNVAISFHPHCHHPGPGSASSFRLVAAVAFQLMPQFSNSIFSELSIQNDLIRSEYAALQSPRAGSYFTCGKCLVLSMCVTSI